MERNAILATVLVIAILVGYQWYLAQFEAPSRPPDRSTEARPTAEQTPAPSVTRTAPTATQLPGQAKGYSPTSQAGLFPKDVVVETPLMRVTLSTAGARVTDWQIKQYRDANGAPVDLVAMRDAGAAPGPLSASADPEQGRAIYQVDRDRVNLADGDQPATVTFTEIAASGIEIQKVLTFHADQYLVGVAVTARNLASVEVPVDLRVVWGPGLRTSADKKNNTLQAPVLWLDGNRVHEDLAKATGEKSHTGTVSWVALQDTYFAAALLPKDKGLRAVVMKGPEEQPIVGLGGTPQMLAPGSQAVLTAEVFAGPKELGALKQAGQDLDKLVDLGWFDFLARPALWLLKFLYQFTGNYGIAIILITVLQKIAFHPLTVKSLRSMRAMQAVQPRVQALQERYKNNPKKKQEEMMTLYRKHGVNPMGGCLPMVVQIPIFIALYNALSNSVEMWQARFLWIRDLTQADSLFSISLWGGYDFHANLLALLMGVSMFVQQKMSPPAGDPRQAQMMLWMMPILFTFMFWGFPSGLVLYWLVNNVLQVGQQWLITRKPARPVAAEEQAA